MQELRERGIYKLPDGREFVIHAIFRGNYVLYTPAAWESFGRYTFDSNKVGQICLDGQTTCWNIKSLVDTNQTAHACSVSKAAQQLSMTKLTMALYVLFYVRLHMPLRDDNV
jgi:hypothetical protein